MLAASPLELGVDPAPGLGSRASSFLHARRLVVDACLGLVQLGARRVVLMTFHGSPLHNAALHAGVEALRARGVAALAPFNYVLQEMLHLDTSALGGAVAHIREGEERRRILQTLALDFTRGFFESSLALVAAPHSVSPRFRALPDCPALVPDAGVLRLGRWAERLGRAGALRRIALPGGGGRLDRAASLPGLHREPALRIPRGRTGVRRSHPVAVHRGGRRRCSPEPCRRVRRWRGWCR